jgi:CheY-like chemotaxis protein
MAHILVVEDDASSLSLIARILQRLGHQTTEAENGQIALDILRQNSDFALILSDVRMAPVDGLNLLTEVRRLYPHIPVLLTSVHGRPEWISQAMEEGARGFLPKPFVKNEVAEAVQAILATINE